MVAPLSGLISHPDLPITGAPGDVPFMPADAGTPLGIFREVLSRRAPPGAAAERRGSALALYLRPGVSARRACHRCVPTLQQIRATARRRRSGAAGLRCEDARRGSHRRCHRPAGGGGRGGLLGIVIAGPTCFSPDAGAGVRPAANRRSLERFRAERRRPARTAARSPAAGRGHARRRETGVLAVARLSPETLEPLCGFIDFRRRLEIAVSELAARLAELPADRWRTERYPLTGERGNTLALGETGVFVISATYPPGHWDDVVTVNRLAKKIQLLLPGYKGQVQPAICHPFSHTEPRVWHRADENGDWVGAWVVGGDSLVGWLEHFGTEDGLSVADLARFDQLARANWLKPAIPTPPSWPPLPDTPRRRLQQ